MFIIRRWSLYVLQFVVHIVLNIYKIVTVYVVTIIRIILYKFIHKLKDILK